MQFVFMPENGTIDAVFILRMLQEEYHAEGTKMYVCFVDLDKAFSKVMSKVLQLAKRRKKCQSF